MKSGLMLEEDLSNLGFKQDEELDKTSSTSDSKNKGSRVEIREVEANKTNNGYLAGTHIKTVNKWKFW